MCGIAGFLRFQGSMDRKAMHRAGESMHLALAHRGPDDADVWQDPDVPLVFAHRRLSILDLSPEGRQPMTSPSGRYVIVFNGQIYNFTALRQKLKQENAPIHGQGDTAVMLAAFDHWGFDAALTQLNGMFAFALWDRKERLLHFARDRFGKKPLYIGWSDQALVFASELKALRTLPDMRAEIDRQSLTLFMQYGYVPAPYSILKDVWQLMPASSITIQTGGVKSPFDLIPQMKPYWSLKESVSYGKAYPARGTEADMVDAFEDLLVSATKERMVTDVPLGAFLSGGIDSSTIVALMQKYASAPIKTFSVGFDEKEYDEAQQAKAVAQHLGTDHHGFTVTSQDALDVIPSLPDIYDEPFADPSQIPTYLVSKLARSEVTVALTGDGGDEILGGYERHIFMPPLWQKIAWIPYPLRRALGWGLAQVPSDLLRLTGVSQADRKSQKLAAVMGERNAADVYAALIGTPHFKENLVKDGTLPEIALHDPAMQPEGLSFAESMIYGDLLHYRPHDLMVKIDRASMAASLQTHAPLMDYRLCDLAWRLPHHMKIRNGQGKWILRQVLKRHVPEVLWDRPKMGFNVPVDQWLRGPLKDWAEDLLDPAQLEEQGLLSTAQITEAWDRHKKGHSIMHTGVNLWSVLMFQAWYKRWMVL